MFSSYIALFKNITAELSQSALQYITLYIISPADLKHIPISFLMLQVFSSNLSYFQTYVKRVF
jgi:hypothetical protein